MGVIATEEAMKQQNIEKLLKLIKKNPELPIIAMVDYEIVADDSCRRWLGAWGDCRIDEFTVSEERIYIKDLDDAEEVLVALMGWKEYEKLTDEQCKKNYKLLSWKKAIIVDIDLP